MIYVTGDIHGEAFRIREAAERFEIREDDIIVLPGDVSMNYFGNRHGDQHRKKRLNKLGVTMFCIHGNHDTLSRERLSARGEGKQPDPCF